MTQMTISYDDFAKLELRVATVLECSVHPNADKLLVLQIELGGERRQICAGLRAHYQPEQLVGRQIVVVANLEPRQMRGQVSQGMLLAASDEASGRVVVLGPAEAVGAGSRVS
jgi:tRNA-binding protein